MADEIVNELRGFLRKLNVTDEHLDKDENVFAESVIDSLQAIDYLIMIEEKFGINVTMQTVTEQNLGRPSAMAHYLSQLVD